MRKNRLSKNTVLICLTAIICVAIYSWVYFTSHRYVVKGNGILDKYTQEWKPIK